MARTDFAYWKLRFYPRWSLWVGGGGGRSALLWCTAILILPWGRPLRGGGGAAKCGLSYGRSSLTPDTLCAAPPAQQTTQTPLPGDLGRTLHSPWAMTHPPPPTGCGMQILDARLYQARYTLQNNNSQNKKVFSGIAVGAFREKKK